MQTVKAKMKCSIINCISLGSILTVKIKRSSEKRIHFVFLFLFEKLQPDALDMYNGLSQVHCIKPEGKFISIQRITFRLAPLQVLYAHNDQRECEDGFQCALRT